MQRQRRRVAAVLFGCLLGVGSLLAPVPAAAASAPRVTSVSAASGPTAGGTRITIRGAHFSRVTAVRFGTRYGTHVSVVSSTKLRVTAPPHGAARVDVRVTTRHGGTSAAVRADRYRYVPPPAVSSVSPSSGRTGGNTRVHVVGAHYVNVRAVYFGTARATRVTVTWSGGLYVTAPPHAAGAVEVRVVTAFGSTRPVAAGRFRYVSPPAVTGLDRKTGPLAAGQTVTVAGANFEHVTGVSFGGAAATGVTVLSPTSLRVRTPAHAAAVVDVRVTTSYGTSPAVSADRYTFGPFALSWRAATELDYPGGLPNGIGCVSASFCLAVDLGDSVMRFNGTNWSAPTNLFTRTPLDSVACASTTFCVATGTMATFFSTDGGRTWSPTPGTYWAGQNVACAATHFCALTDGQTVRTFDGTTFSAPHQLPDPTKQQGWITALSCVSPTFCVAVGDEDPTNSAGVFGPTYGYYSVWSGSSWSDWTATGTTALMDVSCVSRTRCGAVSGGDVVWFDGSSWSAPTQVHNYSGDLDWTEISCVSVSWCAFFENLGVEGQDAVVQTFDGTSWSPEQDIPVPELRAARCAAVGSCVALGTYGESSRLVGESWSDPVVVDPPHGQIRQVSCPAAGWCVAVDGANNVLQLNGTTWSSQRVDKVNNLQQGLDGVSCPVVGFCVVTSVWGYAIVYTDGAWQSPVQLTLPSGLNDDYRLVAVSCATPTFCMAISPHYYYVYDGTSWSSAAPLAGTSSQGLAAVSCTSSTRCVAVDNDERVFVFDGTTWSAPVATGAVSPGHGLDSISCVGDSFCMFPDYTAVMMFNGSRWTSHPLLSANDGSIASISCTAATFCVAVSSGGHAYTYNGSYWSVAAAVPFDGHTWPTSVSCASSSYCVLAETDRVLPGTS